MGKPAGPFMFWPIQKGVHGKGSGWGCNGRGKAGLVDGPLV
jgi:hypothetical protein